jgi:outer membrane receptor for monomeric catechols
VTYVNAATSFETPTTTELVNQPNSTGGFNTELNPQRAVTLELGGEAGSGLQLQHRRLSGRISDAIVHLARSAAVASSRMPGRSTTTVSSGS